VTTDRHGRADPFRAALGREWAGRPIWLLVLAAIGGALLLIVAVTRWGAPSDEHAYWLAARRIIDGLPLYDPNATIITPFAYLYPPPLAQALVPVALVVPSWLFSLLWTAGMLVALWWLAGRDVVRALALVAFLPVAVEFWFRNVHLFLAVLVVLGLRGRPPAFAVGAAVKVSPGLGLVWFGVRRRWRDAFLVGAVGLGILVVSVAIAPDQWLAWIDYLRAQDPFAQSAFFGVPFPIRAAIALLITIVAGLIVGWRGEVLLVAAITLGLPSLWFTGLSLLVAAVPLYRERHLADRGVRGHLDPTPTHPGEDGEDGARDGEG
jgi:hypothetical protein